MPHLNYLVDKSATSFASSPQSEQWDEFHEENSTMYDDGHDNIIRAISDGILNQSSFHDFPWDTSTSEPEVLVSIPVPSTAFNKHFALHDMDMSATTVFSSKHPKQWTSNDIMQWTISEAKYHSFNYEQLRLPNFNVDGTMLCNMSEEEFLSREPEFGKTLYLSLHSIINDQERPFKSLPTFNSSFPFPVLVEEMKDMLSSQNTRENEPADTHIDENIPIPKKRPPGRPRGIRSKRKPEKKCGRLWEFIRDLLLNRDYCPSLICWDDHDLGVFRFVRSEKVAQLWGTIKENPKMTYEKLSRAMRYYYKSQVLLPVLGRRLVYKFGPTATGWRTPDPNFRLSL